MFGSKHCKGTFSSLSLSLSPSLALPFSKFKISHSARVTIEAVMPNLPEARAKEFGDDRDVLGEYEPNHDYKGPLSAV